MMIKHKNSSIGERAWTHQLIQGQKTTTTVERNEKEAEEASKDAAAMTTHHEARP
jgi:hypothetical protein